MQHPDPQFESQNKIRLNNPEVEGVVASVVGEYLAKYLEENPKDAQKIMKKVALAAEAREAASKAKKALHDRKNILSGGGLPGKLFDCTSRDPRRIRVVPGRGRLAPAARPRAAAIACARRSCRCAANRSTSRRPARTTHLLKNDEIASIISAIGVDIGNSEDISGLRYNKIVILTDADVDGQHIRTLLLTLFYRQMFKLLAEGHIYVARPPLYKVAQKKQVRYVNTQEEIDRDLMKRGLDGTKLQVLATPARPAITLEGDRLAALVKMLGELERELQKLERRGLNLSAFLTKMNAQGLPSLRVLLQGQERWFYSMAEVDEFRRAEGQRLGRELVVAEPGQRRPTAPAMATR